MKIWNLYAHFTYDATNDYKSWQKITPESRTFEEAWKLYEDLKDVYGLELSLNK